eukprot:583611-Pyramimonas_sp.AAC.1
MALADNMYTSERCQEEPNKEEEKRGGGRGGGRGGSSVGLFDERSRDKATSGGRSEMAPASGGLTRPST